MTVGVVGFVAAGRRLWPARPGEGLRRSSGMGGRAGGGESRLESCCVTLKPRGRLRRKLGRIDCRGCGEDSGWCVIGSIVVINEEKNKEIKIREEISPSVLRLLCWMEIWQMAAGAPVILHQYSPRSVPSYALTRSFSPPAHSPVPTRAPTTTQSLPYSLVPGRTFPPPS